MSDEVENKDVKHQSDSDLLSSAFMAGARAMFDSLLYRAANNWHADPEKNKRCDEENELIREWAEDALEEVSPDDVATWRSIEDAYKAGFDVGRQESKRIEELEARIDKLRGIHATHDLEGLAAECDEYKRQRDMMRDWMNLQFDARCKVSSGEFSMYSMFIRDYPEAKDWK